MTEELKEFAQGRPERRVQSFRALEEYHAETTKALAEHAERIENRLRRFFFRALLAFAVIGVTSAIALFGFASVLRAYNDVGKQIQNQRRTYLIQTCRDTNERHRRATSVLVTGSSADIAAAETEAEKNDIRRRRDVTIALLDAVAPVENCDTQADDAVQEVK